MRATRLSTLAIVLLATSVTNLSTIVEAYQVPAGTTSQDAYYAAYRDIVQMLLEKQPAIYQEIVSGQLRPGMPGQQGMGFNPYQSYPPVIPGPFNYGQQDANRMGGGGYQLQPTNNWSSSQSTDKLGQLDQPNQMSNPAASSGLCIPTPFKPNIESEQQFPIENVASSEGPVVANLVGYVELLGPAGPSYLPLDINSVSLSEPDDNDMRTVTLSGPCVRFEAIFFNEKGEFSTDWKPWYVFRGLEMFLKNGAEQDSTAKKICEFDRPFQVKLSGDSRFYCKRVSSHQCSKAGKPMARLVLKSFELELGGRQEDAEKRLFNSLRWMTSCDRWKD